MARATLKRPLGRPDFYAACDGSGSIRSMATLERQEIIEALVRVGQLALARNTAVELLLVGGALMVLRFDARAATRDVDAVILAPRETVVVRDIARVVAQERGWPDDWLNDGAKGFMRGTAADTPVFSAPGIRVFSPTIAQLLAMKLSAWRDDVDIADAQRLLREMTGHRQAVWQSVAPYLAPGEELKAQYAFADLWEALHGNDGNYGND